MLWRYILRPALFSFSAESIHHASMGTFAKIARSPIGGVIQSQYEVKDSRLETEIFGIKFPNPVGLAAGFDKDAIWFDVLLKLGFGSIEVGTLTPNGQPGNEKPRLFRLQKDTALLNRMGFNNNGAIQAAKSIPKRKFDGILGINIGKAKDSELEKAVEDHLESFRHLFSFANYVTINVSSPNTLNLRQLQQREHLEKILDSLNVENQELAKIHQCDPKPLLLKISPDLSPEPLTEAIEVCKSRKISGIIATNTTVSREGLQTKESEVKDFNRGGVSGKPLTERSRKMVSEIYKMTEGKIPIVGVGGIMTPDDAVQMICAGASLIQVYTGFIYGGPGFVKAINQKLLAAIEEKKVGSISELVGTSVT